MHIEADSSFVLAIYWSGIMAVQQMSKRAVLYSKFAASRQAMSEAKPALHTDFGTVASQPASVLVLRIQK